MLASQLAYVDFMKNGRTAALTEAARKADKMSHSMLNALRSQSANTQCFDCNATKPGWAALPHGVFICIDCAQLHRHMGRTVSQTKAINTGTYLWFEPELQVMKDVGNEVAQRAFANVCDGLPPKPSRDDAPERKLAYVQAKYAGAKQPDWAQAKASPSKLLLRDPCPAASAPTIKMKPPTVKTPGLQGARRVVWESLGEPPTQPAPRPTSAMLPMVVGDLIDFSEELHVKREPPAAPAGAGAAAARSGAAAANGDAHQAGWCRGVVDPNADFFAKFGL